MSDAAPGRGKFLIEKRRAVLILRASICGHGRLRQTPTHSFSGEMPWKSRTPKIPRLTDDPRLSSKARKLIEQAADIYISAATFWEMAIKVGLGNSRSTWMKSVSPAWKAD
jgi:hypothetical protein